MKKCRYCPKNIIPSWSYCEECGEKMKAKKRKNKKKVV